MSTITYINCVRKCTNDTFKCYNSCASNLSETCLSSCSPSGTYTCNKYCHKLSNPNTNTNVITYAIKTHAKTYNEWQLQATNGDKCILKCNDRITQEEDRINCYRDYCK